MVRITCADGAVGVGYTYTIGTGGSSVIALLRDHLAPRLIGRDAAEIERSGRTCSSHTHATAVGAITSLALAAIDTALWDLRCTPRRPCRCGRSPAARSARVPVYTTEGGWLHHSAQQLVDESRRGQGAGLPRRQDEGRQAVHRRGRGAARRACARRWATSSN